MAEFASFLIHEKSETNGRPKKKPFITVPFMNFDEPATPLTLFHHSEDEAAAEEDETAMKIYLRLRPTEEIEPCYEIVGDRAVVAIPPEESASYRGQSGHVGGRACQQFSFSKLFPAETDQQEVYEQAASKMVADFKEGHDRLLFAYGTTSGGKTHTMNGGRGREAGVLPRAIADLFRGVRLANDSSVVPVDFCEVEAVPQTEAARLAGLKATLLRLGERECPREAVQALFSPEHEAEDRPREDKAAVKVTYWLSFAEVYNEVVSDLLAAAAAPTAKRPSLEVRTARNGGAYVRGLLAVPVFSAEEAYRVLLAGRRAQRVAATKLNDASSRSHAVLTVRAVRTGTGSGGRRPNRVASLSVCDLAGSERASKTGTTGTGHREAGNINRSLMVLGRCMEALRARQAVVPFRESKLTRLFQSYLTAGTGAVAMVVCVNQDRGLFDETMQVLRFSALARQVVLQERQPLAEYRAAVAAAEEAGARAPPRRSHYLRLGLETPARTPVDRLDWDSDQDEEETQDEEEDQEDIDRYQQELVAMIDQLRRELIACKKERVKQEALLREKLEEQWGQVVADLEREHSDRMYEMRERLNERTRQRVKQERRQVYAEMRLRKRKRLEEKVEEDEEEEDSEEGEGVMAARERALEAGAARARVREAEEAAAEARQVAETLAKEVDALRTRLRQAEFEVAAERARRTARRTRASRGNYQTQEEASQTLETGLGSLSLSQTSQTQPEKAVQATPTANRFSSFTRDPLLRTGRSLEVVAPPRQGYFGPLTATATNGSRAPLFEWREEDVNDEDQEGGDSESEASFKRHEEELKARR